MTTHNTAPSALPIMLGVVLLLIGITVSIFLMTGSSAEEAERKAKEKKVAETKKEEKRKATFEAQQHQKQNAAILPRPVTATTPATLTLDYHFRIESDDPIDMMYPGLKKPVRYTPGKGLEKFPAPAKKGPKIFTDPKGGHVGFRIYAVPDDE